MAFLQSALREMRAVLTNRRVFALWLAVTAITVVVGPFNTVRTLSLPARGFYWVVVNGSCFVIAAAMIGLIKRSTLLGRLPALARNVVGSLGIGVLNGIAIVSINALVWPAEPDIPGLGRMLAISVPIALVIGSAIALAGQDETKPAPVEAPPPPTEIAFLKRLPRHLGRDLVSVSVQDHYCEAVTATGRTLVLMRFADALDELTAAEGTQIHRSHWVAFDAVAGVSRAGDGLAVRLKDGRELPVSRSRVAEVREKLRV